METIDNYALKRICIKDLTIPQRYNTAKYLVLILRELADPLGLDIDKYGWISIDAILNEMRAVYPGLEITHIEEIVLKDAQKRFDLSGTKIRAKAGHKYDISIPSPPIEPPEFLYHGTSHEAARLIFESGILRMGKAYVHLASTVERARRIGLRKTEQPVVLKLEARKAFKDGLRFWRSGQTSSDGEIFLSDEIPPIYISQMPT